MKRWLQQIWGVLTRLSELEAAPKAASDGGIEVDLFFRSQDDSGSSFGNYNYSAPSNQSVDIEGAALIRALVSTPAFIRLQDIRFLGALDYCLVTQPNGQKANKRYTRAQHSLGVARLSCEYLNLREHTSHQNLVCIAAALLHDIGHSPFSHTLEPVFQEMFGLDHHAVSEEIILGHGPLGKGVREALVFYGINPVEVIDVLNGDDAAFDNFFSGPINFDTIEGILRSRQYFQMDSDKTSPSNVVEAAVMRDRPSSMDIVDSFWGYKDEVYHLAIRSDWGVFFDRLFQEGAKVAARDLSREDFYIGERRFFKKHPAFRSVKMRSNWRTLAIDLLPAEIPYQSRRFFVDHSVSFAEGNDRERYRQTREAKTLTLSDLAFS